MRRLLTLLLLGATGFQSSAQSSILSLTVVPTNPTLNDNVVILADLSFPSGDCVLDNKGHSVQGSTIVASAHHCLGPLAVICYATDTFEIGQLAAGSYTFDLTLTSGFGQPGCSPGFVIDDNDSIAFVVSGATGILEDEMASYSLFPNPVSDMLLFQTPLTEQSVILDASGKHIADIPVGTTEVSVSHLSTGVYTLRSKTRSYRFVKL